MFDRTIHMIGLVMRADLGVKLPEPELPAGYDWRFFESGDETEWARIQVAADAIDDIESADRAFDYWFPEKEELSDRMLFLTEHGVPVGTAAAWHGDGADKDIGRVHWVAIDKEKQGRGLSIPLIAQTMQKMRELGHASAYLTTQITSWVAIKTYYKFGFIPSVSSVEEKEGWRIVSEKTGIDFMKYIQ